MCCHEWRFLFPFLEDMLHPKRRRTSNSNVPEQKSEPKEQSRSQSQQSSPSQSEHEPTHVKKSISCSYPSSRVHPLFRQKIFSPTCYRLNTLPVNQTNTKHGISRMSPDLYLSSEHPNQIQHEHANVICADACRAQCKAAESVSVGRNLVWHARLLLETVFLWDGSKLILVTDS